MADINGIGSSGSNALRVTGMASGMDTEAMIKKMMAAQNMKADKMKQDRQYVQWQQDAYRDVIKDFRDLRSAYLLIDSPADTGIIKSGTYSGSTITTTDSTGATNNNFVTATALPGAANGVSTVTVNQIAKSAKLQGNKIGQNSVDRGIVNDWNNKKITFSVNDVNFDTGDIKDVTDNASLATKINDAINSNPNLKGKIKASVTDSSVTFDVLTSDNVKITGETGTAKIDAIKDKELNITTSTKLLNIDSTFVGSSFYIKQSGKKSSEIQISSTDTMQDVINKIYNAKSNDSDISKNATTLYTDLNVSFSDLTKSLTVSTRKTGSAESIEIVDKSGNKMDLSVLSLKGDVIKGQDSEVTITLPGSTTGTTIVKSSNNFVVDNVAYNLIKEPETVAGKVIPYTVTLTTKADSQKSLDKIKGFIEKYNALVKKVSDKLGEKKEYAYKPLTDTQKKDMTEEQIKTWEDKAKKGILKNDGELQNILYSLRNAFSAGVKSAGITLKQIGLDTYGGLESMSKPGQFKIDETKLKDALETRGDQVMKLFTASSPTVPATVPVEYASYGDKWQEKYNYDNIGIFKRIEDAINKSSVKSDGNLLKKAGYEGSLTEFTNSLTKNLKDKDKAINEFQIKLRDKENRYYQMFARLEKAMNQMNSQQSWLTQQMGGR